MAKLGVMGPPSSAIGIPTSGIRSGSRPFGDHFAPSMCNRLDEKDQCGGWIGTNDLRVMSPASYHAAPRRKGIMPQSANAVKVQPY